MGIGGEAGQGIATPGDILARIFVRRGLHLTTYNAYQSIIRGGHIFLTVRVSDEKIYSHGDRLDLLLCLNQDTMDRHLHLMGPGSRVVFNSDNIKAEGAARGVGLCPLADCGAYAEPEQAGAEHGGGGGHYGLDEAGFRGAGGELAAQVPEAGAGGGG